MPVRTDRDFIGEIIMPNTTDYELLNELCERLQKLNLKKDLMPKGNNFRAISEAAILEALTPALLELGIDYNITVLDDKLYYYEIGRAHV